jgi:hypothetical protein
MFWIYFYTLPAIIFLIGGILITYKTEGELLIGHVVALLIGALIPVFNILFIVYVISDGAWELFVDFLTGDKMDAFWAKTEEFLKKKIL